MDSSKNSTIIWGTKPSTAPTPAMMPSTMRLMSHGAVPMDSSASVATGVSPWMYTPNSAGSGSSSAKSASSLSLAPASSAAATFSSQTPTASSYCSVPV